MLRLSCSLINIFVRAGIHPFDILVDECTARPVHVSCFTLPHDLIYSLLPLLPLAFPVGCRTSSDSRSIRHQATSARSNPLINKPSVRLLVKGNCVADMISMISGITEQDTCWKSRPEDEIRTQSPMQP